MIAVVLVSGLPDRAGSRDVRTTPGSRQKDAL
jgi:hypothetical protein